MNEKLQGLVRHLLTFAGGFAVSKGWLTADQLVGIVGGIMMIVGSFWSVKAKGEAK